MDVRRLPQVQVRQFYVWQPPHLTSILSKHPPHSMQPVLIRINELNCEYCGHSLFYGHGGFNRAVNDVDAWEKNGCPQCGR